MTDPWHWAAGLLYPARAGDALRREMGRAGVGGGALKRFYSGGYLTYYQWGGGGDFMVEIAVPNFSSQSAYFHVQKRETCFSVFI
jgi:hypothetical protein